MKLLHLLGPTPAKGRQQLPSSQDAGSREQERSPWSPAVPQEFPPALPRTQNSPPERRRGAAAPPPREGPAAHSSLGPASHSAATQAPRRAYSRPHSPTPGPRAPISPARPQTKPFGAAAPTCASSQGGSHGSSPCPGGGGYQQRLRATPRSGGERGGDGEGLGFSARQLPLPPPLRTHPPRENNKLPQHGGRRRPCRHRPRAASWDGGGPDPPSRAGRAAGAAGWLAGALCACAEPPSGAGRAGARMCGGGGGGDAPARAELRWGCRGGGMAAGSRLPLALGRQRPWGKAVEPSPGGSAPCLGSLQAVRVAWAQPPPTGEQVRRPPALREAVGCGLAACGAGRAGCGDFAGPGQIVGSGNGRRRRRFSVLPGLPIKDLFAKAGGCLQHSKVPRAAWAALRLQ